MESESPSSADQTHVQIVVDDEAPVPLYLHESALSPGEFKCYLDYFKLLSRSLDAGDSGKPLRNRVVELGRLRGYLQCFFRNISPDDILQCLGLRTEEHDCLDFNKFLAFFRFLLHTANGEKLTKTLLCVQPSAMDEFPCEMDERPLWLHRTALTQREEEEYIEPFRCLSNCSTSFSASNLDSITLSLSVVHGYSQARFRDIQGLDEVLLKFSPGGIKELNLGQFLAAMRLLVHKCNGEMNSNSMAFIQPSSTSAAFTQHALAPDSSGGIPLRQILDLGLGTEERWNAADDGMHRTTPRSVLRVWRSSSYHRMATCYILRVETETITYSSSVPV
ncbi:hypothetical protein BD410DRAFT_315655 [Rickenella mellea]|uniref:Uncharacterized protein n=1 Tax=Rickenella mellea TaxID=50990 RepID=A0A4Y7Q1J5_9AGAM|nr:hypothetical protein BD410DRAFT_315655 [Rickenella mellea]